MNIRPFDSQLVVRFSDAAVHHVEALDADVQVGYDGDHKIVDITVRARGGSKQLDLVSSEKNALGARFSYDPEIDAVAIDALPETYWDSAELAPGFVVDYDVDGFIRGFEFLDASTFFSPQTMAEIQRRARLPE